MGERHPRLAVVPVIATFVFSILLRRDRPGAAAWSRHWRGPQR